MAQVQLAWTTGAPTEVYPRSASGAGMHFNARGEIIPYSIVPTVASLGSEVVAMTDIPGSPDDFDDMGMELAYPDDEPNEPAPPPLRSPVFIPYTPPISLTPTPIPTSVPLSYTPPTPPPSQSPSVPPQQYQRAPLPRRTPRKSAPGAGTATFVRTPAAAVAGIVVPRLPSSVVAYGAPGALPVSMQAASRTIPAYTQPLPPPVPVPAAAPVYTPSPMPIAAPPVPLSDAPCTTEGCGGRVLTKGRRCLACVKGSWMGRAKAIEEGIKAKGKGKEGTPKPKEGRVTIKLRVTPKAAGKFVVVEPKGKGKAAKDPSREAVSTPKDPVEGKAANPLENKAANSLGRKVASPLENTATDPPSLESKAADPLENKPEDLVEGKSTDSTVNAPNAADAPSEEANIWDGAGWDSELSDLTDSDGESEVEETPRPSFKIRIPARTPTKASPSSASTPTKADGSAFTLPTPPASAEPLRFCTIARCRVPLPPHSVYRWKCCAACRKLYREYQRERHGRLAAADAADGSAPASTPVSMAQTVVPKAALPEHMQALRAQVAQKEWQREENRRALAVAGVPIPGPVTSRRPPAAAAPVTWSVAPGIQLKPKPKLVPGARGCTGHGCEHVIPPADEYEWAVCGMCRARERRRAERAEGKPALKEKDKEREEEMPIAAVKKPGRCMYADCGTLMPTDVSVVECEQCLRRKKLRKTPGRPPGSRNKPKLSVARKPQAAPTPEKPLEVSRKRKRTSPYPAYQCGDALLADFGTRFHGFIKAQSYYYLMRGGTGHAPPAQAMFDFSGEYSVIAADLDVIARKAAVEVSVHAVKDAVARAGGLEFSPTSWVSILGTPGGIVTRFACVHLVDVFLPIRMPPGHPPNPARAKSMQGELEIAVLPDDSHQYFAGEKTIVRFRLVG
ncbi:hypothetical protein DFH07DRAFT_587253 [Mycena maculata]|uniref:Uncharacterized protein n=1 Tax=Mycena maculata TaxID=230809 RepID=A0AAD7IPT7_9AGAR|nr:hypothetical protein DFH07DRAFT_587253 [Mycena maculata]